MLTSWIKMINLVSELFGIKPKGNMRKLDIKNIW